MKADLLIFLLKHWNGVPSLTFVYRRMKNHSLEFISRTAIELEEKGLIQRIKTGREKELVLTLLGEKMAKHALTLRKNGVI